MTKEKSFKERQERGTRPFCLPVATNMLFSERTLCFDPRFLTCNHNVTFKTNATKNCIKRAPPHEALAAAAAGFKVRLSIPATRSAAERRGRSNDQRYTQ
eukprot:g80805.t1